MNKIIITNPEKFEKLKNKFMDDGFNNLQIVSDFDRTLTKSKIKDEEVPSIISLLRKKNYSNKDYITKATKIFNKYHLHEINENLSLSKKNKFMEQWWEESSNLLIENKFSNIKLNKISKSRKIKFRNKTIELFKLLNENNVPLTIISACSFGYDAIDLILKNKKINYNNIELISNKVIWDKNGYAKGFVKPLINSFNKHKFKSKNYNKNNRKNLILLGDLISDIKMSECVKYESIIKIGFLTKKTNKNLEIYKKHYDVLILNDGVMDFVYNFVKEIKNNKNSNDAKNITIETYDKSFKSYKELTKNKHAAEMSKDFIKLLKKNSLILDLGCGPGRDAKIFSNNGFKVIGIDLSKKMINECKKNVKNADFYLMDICDLKFKNNYFDGIWASASLLHVPKKEILKALKESYRVLKKEGIMYVSVKKGKGETLKPDERYHGLKKFWAFYSEKEIKQKLIKAGFKIIDLKIKEKYGSYQTNPYIRIICKK